MLAVAAGGPGEESMSTNPPAAFAGWFRPQGGRRWCKLVEAPSHAAAYDALLEVAHGSGDLLVAKGSHNPNVQPPARVTALEASRR